MHSHGKHLKMAKNCDILVCPMRNTLQKTCLLLLASVSLAALSVESVSAQDTIHYPARAKPVYQKEQLMRKALPSSNSYGYNGQLRSRPGTEAQPGYNIETYKAIPYNVESSKAEISVQEYVPQALHPVPSRVQPMPAPLPPMMPEQQAPRISYIEPQQIPPEMFQTQPINIQPNIESTVAAPAMQAPIPTAPALTTPIAEQNPPAVKVGDAPRVKFFDATQSGSAPSFGAAVNQVAPEDVPLEPELSRASERILEQLPVDIFPDKGRDIQGGFALDRNDATRGIPTGVTFETNRSVGANIAVKRQDMDVNYELEKAYNALLQGNTEIAVMIYNDIINAQPKNKYALFGLATTYHKLGLLEKARPLYGTLLEIDPYDKEALNNFLALVGEEAPDSAITYLEQLKSTNSDFSPIYAQLAQLYKKQGNMRSAILNMQQATAISPDNLIYMYNLAVLYDVNKDTRRAEALYRQILKAGMKGKEIPASVSDIQERLIYLSSN